MTHQLREIEDILKYAAETDPFRVNNSEEDLNYRRITAEEALAQRDGNGSVNLWVNKNEVHNKNNRRGSNDSVTSRRGSNDVGHMRGSNITNNKRYHARLDAGILSDNEEDDIRNNSTRSCSSEESNRG